MTRCYVCINKMGYNECRYNFRMAAGAAGQTVSTCNDVYSCQDFNEEPEEDWE